MSNSLSLHHGNYVADRREDYNEVKCLYNWILVKALPLLTMGFALFRHFVLPWLHQRPSASQKQACTQYHATGKTYKKFCEWKWGPLLLPGSTSYISKIISPFCLEWFFWYFKWRIETDVQFSPYFDVFKKAKEKIKIKPRIGLNHDMFSKFNSSCVDFS